MGEKRRSLGSRRLEQWLHRAGPEPATARTSDTSLRVVVDQIAAASPSIKRIRRMALSGDCLPAHVASTINRGAVRRSGTGDRQRLVVQFAEELHQSAKQARAQQRQGDTPGSPGVNPRVQYQLIGTATDHLLDEIRVASIAGRLADRIANAPSRQESNRDAAELRRLSAAFFGPQALPALDERIDALQHRTLKQKLGLNGRSRSEKLVIEAIVGSIEAAFDAATYPIHIRPAPTDKGAERLRRVTGISRGTPPTTEQLVAQALAGELLNPDAAKAMDREHLAAGIDHSGQMLFNDTLIDGPDDPNLGRKTMAAGLGTAVAVTAAALSIYGPTPPTLVPHVEKPLTGHATLDVAQGGNGLQISQSSNDLDANQLLQNLVADGASPQRVERISRAMRNGKFVDALRKASALDRAGTDLMSSPSKDGPVSDKSALIHALLPYAAAEARGTGHRGDLQYVASTAAAAAREPGAPSNVIALAASDLSTAAKSDTLTR